MRRITTLVLALAFALGGISAAKADGIDVKVKGQWDFAFGWATNVGWADSVHHERAGRNDDNFIARSRVRTQINFITSEYLQGVLMFEIGNLDWGRDAGGKTGNGSGAGIDADGVNVETKRAYLDWIIPNTEVSVRMGIQGVKLPSGPMGSPILDTDVAGIVVSSPITDMFSITGFWLRPFNANLNDGTNAGGARYLDDETDVFGLIAPVKGDGWAVTPWAAYGFLGANSGYYNYLYGPKSTRYSHPATNNAQDHAGVWWAGLNFELTMFDPLKFTFDVMYGDVHKNDMTGVLNGNKAGYAFPARTNNNTHDGWASRGWFLDATLDYKMDWGTPGIFGWWSSGDSANSNDSGQLGRMPILSTDTGWQATTFGALGSPNIATEGTVIGSATGTWGVGVQIANMSFIQDLKHTIRVAYYQGTNDHELVRKGGLYLSTNAANDMYLTDKDHVIEVNFDHEYKIYENLTALLELGYIHLSLDDSTWNSRDNIGRRYNNGDDSNNAWKAQLQFQYKF